MAVAHVLVALSTTAVEGCWTYNPAGGGSASQAAVLDSKSEGGANGPKGGSGYRMHEGVTSPFSRKTIAFLRAIEQNNNRDWFREHKVQYEAQVRAPMIELLGWLARDLPSVAPGLVVDPKVSLYRVYRDTRFSENKAPLKTNAAAIFPPRGFGRHCGAGLYLEIAPRRVWMGGGLYRPETLDLRALREHIADHPLKLHRIVTAPAFRRAVGQLEGARLVRVPRGFPSDHRAAEYLRFKQFLAGRQYPAELAVDPSFYRTLLDTFRALAPLVDFLNAPLRAGQKMRDVRDALGHSDRRRR